MYFTFKIQLDYYQNNNKTNIFIKLKYEKRHLIRIYTLDKYVDYRAKSKIINQKTLVKEYSKSKHGNKLMNFDRKFDSLISFLIIIIIIKLIRHKK